MPKFIEHNLRQLREICERFHVKNLFVFGSANTNTFTETSDIDFLVKFDHVTLEDYSDNFFGLMHELQNLFHRNIDLVLESSLSNPYFVESVQESKVLVYEKRN